MLPRVKYRVKTLVDTEGAEGIIPAGTVIEGPSAFRLVQLGVAEPVCRLAHERAALEAQRAAQQAEADDRREEERREKRRAKLAERREAERAAFAEKLGISP